MKSISTDLATHLTQDVTTLATCWIITRTDGVQFSFTDHDQDLVVDGTTYIASTGYTRTAVSNDDTLAVDNLEVTGVFDSDTITIEDLRAGKFDYAEIKMFAVNWADLSMGIMKIRKGWIGEAVVGENQIFNAELRGLTQALSQNLSQAYSQECRADLGDTRCKVPIQPDLRQSSTLYSSGIFIRVVTNGAASGQAQYENRIYQCTTSGTTASSAPTYDTTVGNPTTDGGISATDTLTIGASVPTAADTVTVGSKTYTWRASVSTTANEVKIGATIAACCTNLAAAINAGAGSGTLYGSLTMANAQASATAGATTVIMTALSAGSAGNSIATTESGTNTSFNHTTLQGGVDAAIFTAVEAWTRSAVVASVTDNQNITITVTDARAVDGWFNGGVASFESGDNDGYNVEIKTWIQTGSHLQLWLPTPYTPQVGDTLKLYPGCTKYLDSCRDKFNNIINMRAEPYVPGQDAILTYPNAK